MTAGYSGHRAGGHVVAVNKIADDGTPSPLPPRHDLINHSPTGFEWGYGGSGPAQLALAILADHLKDEAWAILLHHDFKAQVIAHLDGGKDWAMSSAYVASIVHRLGKRS